MTLAGKANRTLRKSRFPETDIYGITASQFSLGRPNMEVVRQMLEADIKIIQYREKDFPMRQKYDECLEIRGLTARHNACFIVNDDVHLALAVGADGVHVGQDDLPPEKVREIIGEEMVLGLSTHSPEQAREALASGVVDYIGVGPLYSTFTKKDVQPAVGLEYLDYVVGHHDIPFVAIGGIKASNVADVIRHGAKCVCLVTEIVGAADIGAMVRAIRDRMVEARKE
jgi:thiamine-phosphate pyrophosphorylase